MTLLATRIERSCHDCGGEIVVGAPMRWTPSDGSVVCDRCVESSVRRELIVPDRFRHDQRPTSPEPSDSTAAPSEPADAAVEDIERLVASARRTHSAPSTAETAAPIGPSPLITGEPRPLHPDVMLPPPVGPAAALPPPVPERPDVPTAPVAVSVERLPDDVDAATVAVTAALRRIDAATDDRSPADPATPTTEDHDPVGAERRPVRQSHRRRLGARLVGQRVRVDDIVVGSNGVAVGVEIADGATAAIVRRRRRTRLLIDGRDVTRRLSEVRSAVAAVRRCVDSSGGGSIPIVGVAIVRSFGAGTETAQLVDEVQIVGSTDDLVGLDDGPLDPVSIDTIAAALQRSFDPIGD